jgi:thiol peroxidase
MTMERFGIIQFGGVDQTILGPDIRKGQLAPGFTAIANDWSETQPLLDTQGKVRLLASVPSLETAVCDRETRRFNSEAANLDKDVHIFIVSADLPFTQARWCGAAGVDLVTTLSDHLHTDFGLKYGALIKEKRLLRRAVFVIDRADLVTYVAYMPNIGDEPDYEETLQAILRAL